MSYIVNRLEQLPKLKNPCESYNEAPEKHYVVLSGLGAKTVLEHMERNSTDEFFLTVISGNEPVVAAISTIDHVVVSTSLPLPLKQWQCIVIKPFTRDKRLATIFEVVQVSKLSEEDIQFFKNNQSDLLKENQILVNQLRRPPVNVDPLSYGK